jgi:hypothetical protein
MATLLSNTARVIEVLLASTLCTLAAQLKLHIFW